MKTDFLEDKSFFKFPLENYSKSQQKSLELDELFGFKTIEIESNLKKEAKKAFPDGNQQNWGPLLHNDRQAWIGLDPKQLQTPYNEIYFMLDCLKPRSGQKVLDLGAGYGRMALVIESMFKDVYFVGHEYLDERVQDAKNVFSELGLERSQIHTTDLMDSDFLLEESDYYFMYDFGKKEHIKKILDDLFSISKRKNFRLIARGRGCRGVIQYYCPWLSQVFKALHFETFSIYSSYDWEEPT
jgi:hypothetical protein